MDVCVCVCVHVHRGSNRGNCFRSSVSAICLRYFVLRLARQRPFRWSHQVLYAVRHQSHSSKNNKEKNIACIRETYNNNKPNRTHYNCNQYFFACSCWNGQPMKCDWNPSAAIHFNIDSREKGTWDRGCLVVSLFPSKLKIMTSGPSRQLAERWVGIHLRLKRSSRDLNSLYFIMVYAGHS